MRMSSSVIILTTGLVAACSNTYKFIPGYYVSGRGGRPLAQLPSTEQHQLVVDEKRCQQENVWTYTDDSVGLAAIEGAAGAVIAAHGNAATRIRAGLQGASNAASQAQASVGLQHVQADIREAADWNTSDCLKAAGWDSLPIFMVR
jgi:hypothetical protein